MYRCSAKKRSPKRLHQSPLAQAEALLSEALRLRKPNPTKASEFAEQALRLSRANSLPAIEAQALLLLAEADARDRRPDLAIARAKESLAIAGRIKETALVQKAADLLGLVLWQQQGALDEAARYLNQSLTAARKLNDDRIVSRVCNNLGSLQRERGELQTALRLHQEALGLHQRRRDSRMTAISHLNIGSTYGDLGDWESAIECFYRALVEQEKQSDFLGMGICYLNIAEIYMRRGRYERAIQLADLARGCAEKAESAAHRLAAEGLVGEACLQLGDYCRARTIFEQNVAAARQLKLNFEWAQNLRRLAELNLLLGQPEAALKALRQKLPEVQQLLVRADILRITGRAYAKIGDVHQARQNLESALQLLTGSHHAFGLARAQYDMGTFLAEQGARDQGLALIQEAAQTFKRIGAVPESERAEQSLARISGQNVQLALLSSLSTLASHALPLAEFLRRSLRILRETLKPDAATILLEGRSAANCADAQEDFGKDRKLFGDPCTEAELQRCRQGEVQLSSKSLCLPLRLGGRQLGIMLLRWTSSGRPEINLPAIEIAANLLALTIEHAGHQTAVLSVPSNDDLPHYPGFIAHSRKWTTIFNTVERVAPTNANVLIQGETGTGKEQLARIIVRCSLRSEAPFVALNCAALPESLLESELFGIEKGVATGVAERPGRLEQADGGTLFLDEVGDMSLPLQAKLLRVLQERCFERVGGRITKSVDIRVIAATHRNLEKAIDEGRFREDLYYRLNVVTITIPPLRERRSDIPLLINHFISRYNQEFSRAIRGISAEALDRCLNYHWPGNVRELENAIERAVILCATDTIQLSDLPPAVRTDEPVSGNGKPTLRDVAVKTRKETLKAALIENDWNIARTARQVGIDRTYVYRLIRKYSLRRS